MYKSLIGILYFFHFILYFLFLVLTQLPYTVLHLRVSKEAAVDKVSHILKTYEGCNVIFFLACTPYTILVGSLGVIRGASRNTPLRTHTYKTESVILFPFKYVNIKLNLLFCSPSNAHI